MQAAWYHFLRKLAVGADADGSASWTLPPGRFPSPLFQSCHLSWLTVLWLPQTSKPRSSSSSSFHLRFLYFRSNIQWNAFWERNPTCCKQDNQVYVFLVIVDLLLPSFSNLSILKEVKPGNLLEGLKLKLQSFGHLMQRADLLEKTLMLGKIEGRRTRVRWWLWANSGR